MRQFHSNQIGLPAAQVARLPCGVTREITNPEVAMSNLKSWAFRLTILAAFALAAGAGTKWGH
jgi:hypothetical protein